MNFEEFKNTYEHHPVKEYPNQVFHSPKVSVLVQTYQQATYIKDCLEGVLMQKTDFPIEILIGEDDSKDGTRETCIEYAEKYPDKIRLFLHQRENNIKIDGRPTAIFNMFYNSFSCRGNYFAICEGDDYWTDPLKLQKQVDFLDAHPECVLSYHPTQWLDENNPSNNRLKQPLNADKQQIFNLKDYIVGEGLGVWTVSVVGKSDCFKDLPNWLLKAPITDLALKLFFTYHGKIGYIPEIMAVYRRSTVGSWSEFSDTYEWRVKHINDRIITYNLFNKFSKFKYKNEIRATNKWWKEYCMPVAYNIANRPQRGRLIFNNLDYFLNLKNEGNLSRWYKFVFGEYFISKLRRFRNRAKNSIQSKQ